MSAKLCFVLFVVLLCSATLARHHGHHQQHHHGRGHKHHAAGTPSAPRKAAPQQTEAICVMQPTQGSKTYGTVYFKQATAPATGVEVSALIRGLEPGSVHAFHIHQFGDISDPSGLACGGHFNPYGEIHVRSFCSIVLVISTYPLCVFCL